MLDDDIFDSVREVARKQSCPMREVINRALRIGLDQFGKTGASKPYTTIPRPLGLKAGLSYDNVQDLLAHLEGEEFR